MKLGLKLAGIAGLMTVFWTSAGVAAPIPVHSAPLVSEVELVREDRFARRTAPAKAWVRKKGNQTANWMGRQKRKLKNLVD